MRYLTMDQRILYQQYTRLGKEVIKKFQSEGADLTEIGWRIIVAEGIWRIPTEKRFGGKGLTWQDCMAALDGFFGQCHNTELLTLLISQMSSIFLISQYGTHTIKRRFLPRLMQGEMVNLHLSDHIRRLLTKRIALPYNLENSISFLKNNKMYIHAKKINEDIIFTIHEKQLNQITTKADKSTQTILTRNFIFIAKNLGLSALVDLLNFEKLLYGILSASYIKKLKFNLR